MNADMNADKTPPPSGLAQVRFWDHRCERTGWLSNFYAAPVRHGGVLWPTSEHLYQSLKFHDGSYKTDILNEPSAKRAKAIARAMEATIGRGNIMGLVPLMREAIRCKFSQHPELAERLMATRGVIVEASPTDKLWGIGSDGSGINLMGLLLIELRSELWANVTDQTPAALDSANTTDGSSRLSASAIDAVEAGLEYARECLANHDAVLGRTTHKNKAWAKTMENDIRNMERVLRVCGPNDKIQPPEDYGNRKNYTAPDG